MITSEVKWWTANLSSYWTLNDQDSMRSGWVASPHYYININATDGLWGSDIEVETHTIPHDIGEVSGDSFRRGKGFSMSGFIEAGELQSLRLAADKLMEAAWDTSLRKIQWTHTPTDDDIHLMVRIVNDLVIQENYDDYKPRWAWSIGLRADDPRFYNASNAPFFNWQD